MNNLPPLQVITEEQKQRPKVLLLADDITTTSGIATMARKFVENTVSKLNWVQLAAAINHPRQGERINISQQIAEKTGVNDASVVLYPNAGYGDPNKLRQILESEKPDAILHFTDPRFWGWLYSMEYELRTKYKIPLLYYAIWDNFPYPTWNAKFYVSSDFIMGISKQSHLIHKQVLKWNDVKVIDTDEDDVLNYTPRTVLAKYVPHGIDANEYYPIKADSADYNDFMTFKTNFEKDHDYEFIIFWNNRNIRRKQPADVIFAFKQFCDKIKNPEKVALIMHTTPVDNNGTDLLAVKNALGPKLNILFSAEKVSSKILNFYYNMADVTINIASNEGFGLSTAESLMAGTPIIANVTGGLQDQMGFVDENGELYVNNKKVPSNHMGTYKKCGDWAFPVFPSNRSIQGSPATPFIFDDRVSPENVSDKILDAYHLRDELKSRGERGRQFMLENFSAEIMSQGIYDSIMLAIKTFKSPKRYVLEEVVEKERIDDLGIV